MIKSFRLKNDTIENHKINFYESYNALEAVAKLYGFDSWYSTVKYKSSSSLSPTNINVEFNK